MARIFELRDWVNMWPFEEYDQKVRMLADTLPPEKWSYSGRSDYRILTNYIRFTFDKIYDEFMEAERSEKASLLYEDEDKACFNLGLYDKNWQPVFFYCTRNRSPDHQPWYFHSFQTEYTLVAMGIDGTKLRSANYFANPSELVFDFSRSIIPQWEHILDEEENFNRIPEPFRSLGKDICQTLIAGSIDKTTKRIRANYKTVVPQWYRGRIQLLVPLYFTNGERPDLALVISKSATTNQYLGHTCLTCEMAYNNARLISRPESYWLDPL